MGALTEDRAIWRREGHIINIPVKAGAVIYKGALVCSNAGYGAPAADEANLRFCGVAVEHVDNSAGLNGAESVMVWQSGIFPMLKPSATATDTGAVVAAVNDQTVNLLSVTTNDITCGRIVRILSSGEVELKIDGYAY